MDLSPPEYQLSFSQIEDLQLAASKLRGAKRRSFQAEMALKYCGGSARLAETVFSWGRNNVELGMAEKRTREKARLKRAYALNQPTVVRVDT